MTTAQTPELLSLESLHRHGGARPEGGGSREGGSDEKETRYRLHRRFDRLGRLYGDGSVERLMATKVVVFGVGGVGSFAAEALARSAIGKLVLVDFDEVCVTNMNRQLQALKGNIGQPKAEVLAERLRLVNPQADIRAVMQFYRDERADELLESPWGGPYDFVVDCIDNMTAKAHLIATCRERGIPMVASMGAAGRRDPTRIRMDDLSRVTSCAMAKDLRKILRRKHGFPKGELFGIPAVYSTEERSWPRELTYDGGEGFVCVCPHKSNEHGCDSRNLIDGTVAFVTGAFGLAVASGVVNAVVEQLARETGAAAADAPAVSGRPAMDKRGFRRDA